MKTKKLLGIYSYLDFHFQLLCEAEEAKLLAAQFIGVVMWVLVPLALKIIS